MRTGIPAAALALAATPAAAQMTMPMGQPAASADIGTAHDAHAAMNHGAHAMLGALGPYAANRESSGTAWQPDSSNHEGLHLTSGDWTLLLHGQANLIYDWQEQPRGDRKTFVSGHLIATARRPLGNGTLQFRTILSPDPLIGKRGYPLLLASGETADGVTRLIDRQHPHDLVGELSVSVSQTVAPNTSLFLYAGLPGEPAFGPPVYLHRESINTSPEAPITHHWLDSTHTSFGVVTAGVTHDRFKLEASRFNAREPDQHRYNIETGPLDSTAVRLSINPTRTLSIQASWARLKDPEQLEPGVDQRRLSASGHFTLPLRRGSWATTLAWGQRRQEGHSDGAVALESSLRWDRWTLFGRAERTENRELFADPDFESPAYKVGKVSLGALYEVPVGEHLGVGVGGLYALNFVPAAIEPIYGGDPHGAMGFLRLRIR